MKLKLIALLRKLLHWLEDHGPVIQRALELARMAEVAHQEAGGEFKRHQVYARLIKEFPDQNKRVLARAIESALDAL